MDKSRHQNADQNTNILNANTATENVAKFKHLETTVRDTMGVIKSRRWDGHLRDSREIHKKFRSEYL